MDEENLFALTDELMLRAKEEHMRLVKRLEKKGYTEADILGELELAIDAQGIDWARIYILAVLGVQLDA